MIRAQASSAAINVRFADSAAIQWIGRSNPALDAVHCAKLRALFQRIPQASIWKLAQGHVMQTNWSGAVACGVSEGAAVTVMACSG